MSTPISTDGLISPAVPEPGTYDITQAYELLKRRRAHPFFTTKNLNDEARLAARYAAGDRDCSITFLCMHLHTRKATVRAFLLAWGVEPKTRAILPAAIQSIAA